MELTARSDASLYTCCNCRTQNDEINMLSKDRHGGEEHIPRSLIYVYSDLHDEKTQIKVVINVAVDCSTC